MKQNGQPKIKTNMPPDSGISKGLAVRPDDGGTNSTGDTRQTKKETAMKITRTDTDAWTVLSDSGKTYRVFDAGCEDASHGGGMHCSCPANRHGKSCKHLRAVIETALNMPYDEAAR